MQRIFEHWLSAATFSVKKIIDIIVMNSNSTYVSSVMKIDLYSYVLITYSYMVTLTQLQRTQACPYLATLMY